jgi:hypothetical protein
VLDTGDEAAVDRFFTDEAPWDHVVVSAAQTRTGPVRTLALADAKAAMESKFWGAYRVARIAKIKDGGSLTFVSGFLSVRPSASSVLQGAINAALEALARASPSALLARAGHLEHAGRAEQERRTTYGLPERPGRRSAPGIAPGGPGRGQAGDGEASGKRRPRASALPRS